MEQRAFYRLISGLHTSINIHLSSDYLLSEAKDFMSPAGVWGRNIEEFNRRYVVQLLGTFGQLTGFDLQIQPGDYW